jgi:hypothetical protein
MADVYQKEEVMNTIGFAFSLNRTAAALSCVWFTTESPAHPLACKWISRDELDASSRTSRFMRTQFEANCA